MVRFIVIVAVALAAMPAAAVAAAQPNPFLPQPQQQAPQDQAPAQAPVAPAPVQQPQSDGGISSGTATLMIAGAIALIAAIWFVIARDARRATAGRVRVQTSRTNDPDVARRRGTRPPPRGRKVSPAERRRRKRGRAR